MYRSEKELFVRVKGIYIYKFQSAKFFLATFRGHRYEFEVNPEQDLSQFQTEFSWHVSPPPMADELMTITVASVYQRCMGQSYKRRLGWAHVGLEDILQRATKKTVSFRDEEHKPVQIQMKVHVIYQLTKIPVTPPNPNRAVRATTCSQALSSKFSNFGRSLSNWQIFGIDCLGHTASTGNISEAATSRFDGDLNDSPVAILWRMQQRTRNRRCGQCFGIIPPQPELTATSPHPVAMPDLVHGPSSELSSYSLASIEL